MLDDIEQAFRESVGDSINHNSYTRSAFGKHLKELIDERKNSHSGDWKIAYKKQGPHPVNKEDKRKPTIWYNVGLSLNEAADRFARPLHST